MNIENNLWTILISHPNEGDGSTPEKIEMELFKELDQFVLVRDSKRASSADVVTIKKNGEECPCSFVLGRTHIVIIDLPAVIPPNEFVPDAECEYIDQVLVGNWRHQFESANSALELIRKRNEAGLAVYHDKRVQDMWRGFSLAMKAQTAATVLPLTIHVSEPESEKRIFIVWTFDGKQHTNEFNDTPDARMEARELLLHVKTLEGARLMHVTLGTEIDEASV